MITVITGPPCSGKTTYLREHARPGDIVIDYDAICQAIGSPASHDHDPVLREIAAAAWAAAIARIIAEHHAALRAWIIDSRPTKQRREDYRRIRARIVSLTASATELHRRAEAEGRSADWHQRIDAFLEAGQGRRDPVHAGRTRW